MKREDVDLQTHLDIDPGQLGDDVQARLEEYIAGREQRLVELRERALDAEQETKVLRQRVDSLQEQVASLETEVGEPAVDARHIEATTVLSSFGDALKHEQLQETGFTVSDISVDLRANVVNTDDGVRLHLPEPGSSIPDGALSELRFSVKSDPDVPEVDYEEVPDVVGMMEAGATDTIRDAGFEVGSVETVPSDEEGGRVVDQLPSPFSLADPGAPVDLEVAEAEPAEMVDLIGERLTDAVRFVGDRFTLRDIETVESDEPPGTVLDQDPEPGKAVSLKDRLALTVSEFRARKESGGEDEVDEDDETGSDGDAADGEAENGGLEEGEEAEGRGAATEDETADDATAEDGTAQERAGREAAPVRETADGPMSSRMAERLLDAMDPGALPEDDEPLVDRDVTDVDGIGDTYGQRLRNAGIESLADLAVAEPIEVADAANVSRDRARDWIEAVREHLDARSDDVDRHGPEADPER